VDIKREMDIEHLRRIALAQQTQIEQLLRLVSKKSAELDALRGGGEDLQRSLDLLTASTQKALEAAAAPSTPAAPRSKAKRQRFGAHPQPKLPRVPALFELDAPDKTCPSCGGDLAPMPGQFESAEMIDVVEVSYRVVEAQRQKYVCRCGGCVETAPGPERATPGSRYSLAFAVKVGIDKYLDHLPLARQVRMMERHGLEVTTQTLWDLINAVAARLEGHYGALLARIKQQPVIGLDQTGWPRLEKPSAKPWQMWCLTAPGLVYHQICDDKGTSTFTSLVGDFEGVIVCDALQTHAAGAREGPGIVLAGCWAHVYRKFEEAEPDHPDAQEALRLIGSLYEIDARAGPDLAALAVLRRTDSAAVLAELKAWLWQQAVLKTLSIGKAAAYAISNWERLIRIVEDPRIPLDNNATERAIRGPVVGRKNHYGSKSQRGTEVAALFYSLIETAKLHGLNPTTFLLDAVIAESRGEIIIPGQTQN
jgi:transposase